MSILKRSLRGTLCCLTLLALFTCTTLLQADVITIPDANLRAAIEAKLGKNPGDPITDAEMATLTELIVDNQGISDLSGLEHGISIERLILSHNKIEDLSPLCDLNGILELDLSYNPISDVSLLSSLNTLQTLSICSTDIADISPLSGLTNLQTLHLIGNQISDISGLTGLANLQTLRLLDNLISDLSPLTSLGNLESLDLAQNQIDDISVLSSLPGLRVLDLSSNQIVDISPLSAITDPVFLYLERNQIVDISPLRNLTNLSGLWISKNQIEDISILENIENLVLLFIDDNQIRDISAIAGMSEINSFWVQNNYLDISDGSEPRTQVIDPLIRKGVNVIYSPQYTLTTVTIPDPNLRAVVETALGKNPGNPITSVEMNTMTELRAETAGISDLTGLEYAMHLQSLSLGYNAISDISPLSGLVTLQYLNLGSNEIQDISALNTLTGLQTLDLRENQIQDIPPLNGLAQLQSLFLDENQITDISTLSIFSQLLTLSLSTNQITDISPLTNLTDLVTLYLNNNLISDVPSLVCLINLRILGLNDNQIVDISALSYMPELGAIISSLDLKNNYIDISNGSEARTQVIDPLIADGVDVVYAPQKTLGLVSIPDANLRAAIETELGKNSGDPITDDEMATLTELVIYGKSISDLAGLEYGVSIERLLLSDNEIEDLSPLSNLNELREITLSWNPISDVSPLSNLSSLQVLNLSRTGIADITPLSNLTNLQELYLSNNQIAAIPSISGMTSLKTLELNSNQIEDLSGLEGVTSLNKLSINSNQIEDISALIGITNLQWLESMNNLIRDITPLSGLENLNILLLSDNRISNLSPLIGMELQALTLENNYIDILDGSDARKQVINPLIAAGGDVFYKPQYDLIAVSPKSIILNCSPGDSISGQFTIDYRGLGNLTWNADTSHDWISVDPSSGIVVQDSTATVTFSIASVPDFTDSLTATIILSTDDPDAGNPEISIEMHRYVDIPDANLRAAIEARLGKDPGDPITKAEMSMIDYLVADNSGISNLTGLEHAVNLLELNLQFNQITNLSPISDLTGLRVLYLNDNLIRDISPLGARPFIFGLFGFYIQNNYLDISDGSAARTQVIDPMIASRTTVTYTPQHDSVQPILLSPSPIILSGYPGDSISGQFTIANTGLGNVSWSADTSHDWISVDPASGNLIQDGELTIPFSIDPIPEFPESSTATIVLSGNHPNLPAAEISIEVHRYIEIPDANLRAAIETELGKNAGDPITDVEMATMIWLNSVDNQISDLTGLEHAANLQDLTLENNKIADLSPLSELTYLRNLHLESNQIEDLSPLGRLANLVVLKLNNNQITDLSPLGGLEKLQGLELENNQITDLSPLGTLSSLHSLYLRGNPIEDVSALAPLSSLRSLNLRSCQINDLSSLSSFSYLTSLDLSHNTISDLSPISEFIHLHNLNLSQNQIEDISPLSNMVYLDYLSLHNNQIEDLSPLSGMAAYLRTLNLCENEITDISSLSGLTNLRYLYLAGNSIEDISPVSGLERLRYLLLSRNQVANLTPLSELTELRSLYLDNNQVEDLSPLSGLTELAVLFLEENQISNLSQISGLEGLIQLELSQNQIEDISPLAGLELGALDITKNLIDISDGSEARTLVIDPLIAAGADVEYTPQLASKIAVDPTSKKLCGSPGDSISFSVTMENMGTYNLYWAVSTSSSWITSDQQSGMLMPGDETIVHLTIESIPYYTESIISSVTISSNDQNTPSLDIPFYIYPPISIPDSSLLTALQEALGLNPGDSISSQQLASLAELDLSGHNIVDLSGLEHAVNLTSLNLSNNQISDLPPLAGLTNLTHLYLYNNKITDIAALAELDQLEVLRIYGNYIDIADGSEARTGVIDPLIEAGAEVLYTPQLESEIEISPTSLVLIGNPGDSLSASINLANTGTNDLVWSSSSGDAWITTDPANGTIEPGNSQDVAITIDPVPDFSDVLSGIITLASNDADTPVVDIPVDVHSPIEIDDAELRSAIEEALGLDPDSPIIAPQLATLTYLDASHLGISDLSGLEYATSLEELYLQGNEISDISPLAGLANLLSLNLQDNIIDISEGSDALVQVIDPLIAGGTNVVYSPQRTPELTVDPMEFIFVGEPEDTLSFSISVGNTGEMDLTWSISEAPEWISIDPLSGTISPAGSVSTSLSIDSVPAFVDSLTGSIVLESNDPDTPSVILTVEIYPPIDIPDANLRSILEEAIDLESGAPIIAPQLANLTELDASERNIVNLSGIGYAVNLVSLDLGSNFIADLAPLQSLSSLEYLNIRMNLLDIRSESDDWQVLNQIDAYADVHYDPQRYPMRSYADFLVDHSIPEGRDGYLDKNGPLEIPNLMAFAMGIDPMTAAPGMLPQAVRDEAVGTCSFCFHRNLAAMDVDLLIESSADMQTWTPVSPGELNILSDDGDGQQYVEAIFEEEETMLFRVRAVPDGQ